MRLVPPKPGSSVSGRSTQRLEPDSAWFDAPRTAEPGSGALDEEPGGGLFADRLLAAVDRDTELSRGRFGGAQLERRAGDKSLVVEPVQQVAVVLGEADDRR